MYENIHIETDRLVIRNFSVSDIQVLYKIINDEEIMRYVPFTEARSMPECHKLMEAIIERYSESTGDCFMGFLLLAVSKETGAEIGFAGLYPLSYDTTRNELFYGVFSEYRKKGFAVEIGRAVMNYGFSEIGMDEIVATVNVGNELSKGVVERMGLHFGYVIEDEAEEDSSYQGELLYSISREAFI